MLTEAAIWGKTDRLLGLKENVIIGKLIPSQVLSLTEEVQQDLSLIEAAEQALPLTEEAEQALSLTEDTEPVIPEVDTSALAEEKPLA